MITITNVTKSFDKMTVVNDISFNVKSGQITGLIGSNGSGKSTTMRMIATLLKQDCGQIIVNDIDTIRHPHKARREMGILLGGDIALYERLTARENIIYFSALQGIDMQVAEKRLNDLSKLLDMQEYLDRKTIGFSRGMRQKVAFARAIIHSPSIILLDEPSTGLDINSIRDVQNFILYCKSQEKTILISTHNSHEIDKLCDNLVFIENGKIQAQGEKTELLRETGCTDSSDLFFYFKERSNNEKIYNCIKKRTD